MHTDIEEFIFNSNQANNVKELLSLYDKAMEGLGYDRYIIALLNDHPRIEIQNELGIIVKKGLEQWEDHYIEQHYIDIDPMISMSLLKPGPVTWEDVLYTQKLSAKQRGIFTDSQEMGIYNVHYTAFHGGYGSTAIASASTSERSFNPESGLLDKTSLLSFQAYTCVCRLLDGTGVHNDIRSGIYFSLKEQEVLKWTAKGLNRSEIGNRLNISLHTVDYHTRKIMKKLDVNNIAAAVAIAISKRLIHL